MKLVNQSYQFMDWADASNHRSVLRFLERIGRTCYKSENKITDESAYKYLNMLRVNKHWAMLEHYVFIFEVSGWHYNKINFILGNLDSRFYDTIDLLSHIRMSYYRDSNDIPHYLVSLSPTCINYLYGSTYFQQNPNEYGIPTIYHFLRSKFPELIQDYDHAGSVDKEILGCVRILSNSEMLGLNKSTKLVHVPVTIKFITNIQIANEIVRHRPCSFAQESTRYCMYMHNKFDNQLTMVNPKALGFKGNELEAWKEQMQKCEDSYLNLTGLGCSAQQAAQVLPKATKTELVVTARLSEWKHIFNMRADAAAHPQMQELMYPLLEDFYHHYPECFEDQIYRIEEGKKNGWIST